MAGLNVFKFDRSEPLLLPIEHLWHRYCFEGAFLMEIIQIIPFAAIEYSLIYMLGGGGLIGAFVIFLIARMLRR